MGISILVFELQVEDEVLKMDSVVYEGKLTTFLKFLWDDGCGNRTLFIFSKISIM